MSLANHHPDREFLFDLFAEDVTRFIGHLLAFDVPMWVAEHGWGENEVRRPNAWPKITCTGNEARIQRFHLIDSPYVCANTGDPWAVVDVDTKNGADVDKMRAALAERGVRIYAEITTPSGGKHFWIEGHPDLPTVHSRPDNPKLPDHPAVDIQSHGANVYTPGTLRAKYGGTGYTIDFDELNQFSHHDCHDEHDCAAMAFVNYVAEQLAVGVTTKARKTSGGAKEWAWDPCEPWDGTPPDNRQSAYLHAAVTGEAAKVARTAKGGRNDAIFTGALKLGSYVAGACLDEPTVIAALEAAAEANGFTEEHGVTSTRATIRSGLRGGRNNPRAVPPKPRLRRRRHGW